MNEVLLNQKAGSLEKLSTESGAGEGAPVLNLIAVLKARQICYCHWKSNIRLADSLSGKEDLDLLVLRADATQFYAALFECGFKLAQSQGGGGHPGVLHAFALDPNTLRLVHVHAYFQVVTGDSLVKSYHLPLEQILLSNIRPLMGLPVPSAEAEMVVFLLRIVLKHTGLLEFWMVNRHYAAVPQELAWLRSEADEVAARQLWMQSVPGATAGEFDALIAAIADPARVGARIRIGLRLAWRLREWRRLGYWAAFGSRLRRFGLLVASRLRRRRPVCLASGGALIALIGPKASGKSTLGSALEERLGKQLDVRRVHIGKPPATLLSSPFRLFLPMLRRLLPGERSGQYQNAERRADLNFSYPYVMRMLLLAHDRRKLLFKIRGAATGGAIVITDRYPPSGDGAIDGRQFGAAAIAACGSRWKAALMRREARLYDDLPKPDLVIRLTAPIQTTLLRDASRSKQDGPDPDSVLRRRNLETMAEFPDVPVLLVNTDAPLEQSIAEVLRAAWQSL